MKNLDEKNASLIKEGASQRALLTSESRPSRNCLSVFKRTVPQEQKESQSKAVTRREKPNKQSLYNALTTIEAENPLF